MEFNIDLTCMEVEWGLNGVALERSNVAICASYCSDSSGCAPPEVSTGCAALAV